MEQHEALVDTGSRQMHPKMSFKFRYKCLHFIKQHRFFLLLFSFLVSIFLFHVITTDSIKFNKLIGRNFVPPKTAITRYQPSPVQNSNEQPGEQVDQQSDEKPFLEFEKIPLMVLWIRSYKNSTAVVNLQRSMDQNCEWKCLPLRTSPSQKYFIYFREAPTGADRRHYLKLPPNFINFTIGFVPGSDIYAGYNEMVPIDANFFGQRMPTENDFYNWNKVRDIVMKKTKGGFAVISHCDTYSRREEFLKEIKSQWPDGVDLFGSCYGGRCEKEECMTANLKSYHFYFAFENSICDQYVTEKFFHIKDIIVPIVFRRSDYRHILPDSAYISIEDYNSIEDLVKHLDYLTKNKEEYLKYFEWTQTYQKSSPNQLMRALCHSCRMLHDNEHVSFYKNVSSWYSPEKFCDNNYAHKLYAKLTGKIMPKQTAKFIAG